ncbi:undecaprenyl-phosphate alpha-N-acetylglucosaminyl 1-phosphate transferase, partial [Vibrio sp. OPT46]|nr:undecaprenyl-phosphate alpha-N-acetylglucosaminyl 1-phosphate transferase [Vibrio sp. OPT46]
FIGFSVVWMLIRGTQEPGAVAFKPVTALWLIALPLMDMATIMIRRIRKGQSPFQPDREHLHHICQRIGLSPGATLIFICSMASICAAIGLWADFTDVSESTMFLAFIILFACYFSIISHIWRVSAWINRMFKKPALMGTEMK